MRLELSTSWFENQVPIAFELNSSNARARKESSLYRWCIAPLPFYHISSVIDSSFEKYICSTGHNNSWYVQSEFSEDAYGEAQTHNLFV